MADLDTNLARGVAHAAIDRAGRIQVERNSSHGFSLDTITELAAMVLNLADRVDASATKDVLQELVGTLQAKEKCLASGVISGRPVALLGWFKDDIAEAYRRAAEHVAGVALDGGTKNG